MLERLAVDSGRIIQAQFHHLSMSTGCHRGGRTIHTALCMLSLLEHTDVTIMMAMGACMTSSLNTGPQARRMQQTITRGHYTMEVRSSIGSGIKVKHLLPFALGCRGS